MVGGTLPAGPCRRAVNQEQVTIANDGRHSSRRPCDIRFPQPVGPRPLQVDDRHRGAAADRAGDHGRPAGAYQRRPVQLFQLPVRGPADPGARGGKPSGHVVQGHRTQYPPHRSIHRQYRVACDRRGDAYLRGAVRRRTRRTAGGGSDRDAGHTGRLALDQTSSGFFRMPPPCYAGTRQIPPDHFGGDRVRALPPRRHRRRPHADRPGQTGHHRAARWKHLRHNPRPIRDANADARGIPRRPCCSARSARSRIMTGRRTVIRGGLVLDAEGRASQRDVLIEDGRILAIDHPGFGVSDDARALSAADRLLIPGLISAHTHSHGALNRGAVDDKVSLEMFLTGGASGSESRGVKDKYLSTALSAAEMIRKGCTACYDLSAEFPLPSAEGISAMGRAYRDAGMRAVVAPMITDKTIYEALPGLLETLPDDIRSRYASLRPAPRKATTDACARILANWDFDRRWIRPALGPSIPLHCSDEFLTECARLASEYDVPLQTHLAESRAQASLGLARYGKSLVEHLEDLDFLSERLSAAHAIWLDDDDIARLAQRALRCP